ncbi:carbon-nitrogen hydrolase family protein [Myxococcota bacterium]|nr:carbon-nitrogen hydrolase family protein [Myxococcota bacterium]
MRIGVVQMTSTDDVGANLETARSLVDEAADRGAGFVLLPENFAFLRREGSPVPCAEGLDGEVVETARAMARQNEVWLLAGSFAEAIDGDSRLHNTSVLVQPNGDLAAVYRKIHLFDVDLSSSGGGVFSESRVYAPGKDVVVAPTPFGGVGLSVCYDLRFPELYREMAAAGASWLTVPSAFTPQTGKDHWEVLLRARAIENQAFVIAPAQCGRHSPDRASYGRSLIIDPWGIIIAQAGDQPGVIVAECDEGQLLDVRRSLPALAHRRL